MMVVTMSEVCAEQWGVARSFWRDRRTRTPILMVWVASFGGALHASVTTYYYLEVKHCDSLHLFVCCLLR